MTSQVLFVESSAVELPLERLEREALRRPFSDLFDRAAQRVFRLGLDLDDVTVERFIVCRTAQGAEHRVEAPSIAKVEPLYDEIVAYLERVGKGPLPRRDIAIVALGVEVISGVGGRE